MNINLPTVPSVSVAICTRDRPRLLERCLESLARLSPPSREVLVVDQSQDQDSEQVVKRFGAQIPSLRYLQTSSRGVSHGRNLAIRAAKGEILAFTDDDCLVRPDWVGQLSRLFAEDPELAMVTGGSLPEADESADRRVLAAATWHPSAVRTFARPVDPALVGGTFNLSFRLSWTEKIGLFDPDLGPGSPFKGAEDSDFIHRTLSAGGLIRYDPRVVVAHAPWRDGHTQSRTEFDYGYGLGAWAVKRLQRGDCYPMRVAGSALLAQARRLVSGIIRRDNRALETGWSYVSGLGRGAAAWIRRGSRSGEKPKTEEGREVSA